MDKLDLYTPLYDTNDGNFLIVSDEDYSSFAAKMAQFNSECVINDAASWKAASEIVLTD